MSDAKLPALSPEERAMSISKYYDIPLPALDPIRRQILERPLDPASVTPPQRAASLLRAEGYTGSDYGYCMMPDGSGFLATYSVFRNCTMDMLKWWFAWMNTKPANMPQGRGNIKYKVWFPYGHFDHGPAEAPDGTECVCASEALDLCEDGDPIDHIYMHEVDPLQFGASPAALREMERRGCVGGMKYETFDYPGMHLCVSVMRELPGVGIENIGREWIGYGIRDGAIIRDEVTPVDEAFLKKVVRHCTLEMMRLDRILPDLYAEYHDRPADAAL